MVKPKFSNEEMSEMVALFYRHGSARRAAIAFGEIHQPVDYRLILRSWHASYYYKMNGTVEEPLISSGWSEDFLASCRFWIPNLIAPIIFITGLIGNVVTLIVLTRKRMRGSTNVYLTALAGADLVFLLIYISIVQENRKSLRSSDFLLYWEYWRFGVWLLDAFGGISTWLTVSFTLERYIAVCHPLRGRVVCTETRARRVVLAVIVVCLLSTASTPFEWEVTARNSTVLLSYSELGKSQTYQTLFYSFTSIVFVFLPLVILSALNFLLIQAVRRSRLNRRSMTQMTSRKAYREKQENKITVALVAVVFLFLICQTPTAVTLIASSVYKPKSHSDGDNMMRALGNICNSLVALYTATNFLLYCAMSDKYRRTMCNTFCPGAIYSQHSRAGTFTSNASYRNSSIR